jgi:hypothetical protein
LAKEKNDSFFVPYFFVCSFNQNFMIQKLFAGLLFSFLCFQSTLFGQTTVIFRVDAADFIAGGGVMAGGVVSIAGNFADRGGNKPNWVPPAGSMTALANNVYTITITFTGPTVTVDSLNWKYVQGTSWANGDEGNDWTNNAPDCKKPNNNYDRKLKLPAAGTWL